MTSHHCAFGILTLVLLWTIASCQLTDLRKETCTYSFVVPRFSLTSNVDIPGPSKNYENSELQGELAELRTQWASLARRIEALEGGATILTPSEVITGSNEGTDVVPGPTATVYVMNANSTRAEVPLRAPPFSIYCTRDKYILVQSRHLGLEMSFNRSYADYKNGFGSFHSEFWIGLEKLHLITSNTFARFSLRLEGRMSNGYDNTVEYHDVRIGDERSGYRLTYKSRGTATRGNGNLATNVIFSCRGAPYVNGTHACARSGYNGWWFRNTICKKYDLNFNADQPFWDLRVPVVMTQIALKPLYG